MESILTLYKTHNLDFTLTPAQFTQLLQSSIPSGSAASHRLLKAWDAEANGGVDFCEVMCGLVLACSAPIPDKIPALFNVFDFDGTGAVTYDEAFVLVSSSLRAMVRVVGRGREPDDADVEKYVDEMYLSSDVEPTSKIQSEHFKEWVTKENNFGIKKGQTKKIEITGVMVKYDVLDADDAKEIEQAKALMKPTEPKKKKKRKSHVHHKDNDPN